MKVLFLDWDGVCNNDASLAVAESVNCRTWAGDINCINLLRDFIMATDAKIVLSSAWRLSKNEIMKEMCPEYFLRAVLAWWGLSIFDRTPDFEWTTPRSHEIRSWLKGAKARDQHIDSFVIFDDHADAGDIFENHFVHTNPATGLTRADIEKAKNILINRATPTWE